MKKEGTQLESNIAKKRCGRCHKSSDKTDAIDRGSNPHNIILSTDEQRQPIPEPVNKHMLQLSRTI